MKALEKYGIGKQIKITSGNKVNTDCVQLTLASNDEEVKRIYQLMAEKAHEMGLVFDPLNLL